MKSASDEQASAAGNTAGERWEVSVGDRFRTRDKGWLTILSDCGKGYFNVRHSELQPVCQSWATVRFDGAECHHAYLGRYRFWDIVTREDPESPAVLPAKDAQREVADE